MNANSSKALALEKLEPHLLLTHALQYSEHTKANDQNICVINCNIDGHASLSCSISDMDKYMAPRENIGSVQLDEKLVYNSRMMSWLLRAWDYLVIITLFDVEI